MGASGKRKRRKIRKLCAQQDGRCYYCNCEMLIIKGPADGRCPPTMATIEHLDHRSHKPRIENEEQRVVAACWKCNQEMGRLLDQNNA
jgi:5-methylcytosine-specific restriction endonuclease McrA